METQKTLIDYYPELDKASSHFRNHANSFHYSEDIVTPVSHSAIVWLEGLVKSRGAKRGVDYSIDIVTYEPNLGHTESENYYADVNHYTIIAIHVIGFVNPKEDAIGRGPYIQTCPFHKSPLTPVVFFNPDGTKTETGEFICLECEKSEVVFPVLDKKRVLEIQAEAWRRFPNMARGE